MSKLAEEGHRERQFIGRFNEMKEAKIEKLLLENSQKAAVREINDEINAIKAIRCERNLQQRVKAQIALFGQEGRLMVKDTDFVA